MFLNNTAGAMIMYQYKPFLLSPGSSIWNGDLVLSFLTLYLHQWHGIFLLHATNRHWREGEICPEKCIQADDKMGWPPITGARAKLNTSTPKSARTNHTSSPSICGQVFFLFFFYWVSQFEITRKKLLNACVLFQRTSWKSEPSNRCIYMGPTFNLSL